MRLYQTRTAWPSGWRANAAHAPFSSCNAISGTARSAIGQPALAASIAAAIKGSLTSAAAIRPTRMATSDSAQARHRGSASAHGRTVPSISFPSLIRMLSFESRVGVRTSASQAPASALYPTCARPPCGRRSKTLVCAIEAAADVWPWARSSRGRSAGGASSELASS